MVWPVASSSLPLSSQSRSLLRLWARFEFVFQSPCFVTYILVEVQLTCVVGPFFFENVRTRGGFVGKMHLRRRARWGREGVPMVTVWPRLSPGPRNGSGSPDRETFCLRI